MKTHFKELASYGAWANERLLSDAAILPQSRLDEDIGLYFKSLSGTLIHLLQSDRAWMHLLRGGTLNTLALREPPSAFPALHAARIRQDQEFIEWIEGLDPGWFGQPFTFVSGLGSSKGSIYRGTHASALTHVLNHQTHHRGQAHAALTILGVREPRALDILVKGFSRA